MDSGYHSDDISEEWDEIDERMAREELKRTREEDEMAAELERRTQDEFDAASPEASSPGDAAGEDDEGEPDPEDSYTLFWDGLEYTSATPPAGHAGMDDELFGDDLSDSDSLFGEGPVHTPASSPVEDAADATALPETQDLADSVIILSEDEDAPAILQAGDAGEKETPPPPPPPKKKPTGLSLPPRSAATIVRGPLSDQIYEIGLEPPEMPHPSQQQAGQPQAYPGALIPATNTQEAAVRPAMDVDMAGVPSEEELWWSHMDLDTALSALPAELDDIVFTDLGDQLDPVQLAENPLLLPAAPPINSGFLNVVPAPQRHLPAATIAPRQLEMPRAIPLARAAPLPPAAAPPPRDEVGLEQAAGRWGRWDPRGMESPHYVQHDRQPYNSTNPRDVYDFMQAVVASMTRVWPYRAGEPSRAAVFWFDRAWQMIGQALRAQVARFSELPRRVHDDLLAGWDRVEQGSLMGSVSAEWDVDRAMAALTALRALPPLVIDPDVEILVID